MHFSSIHASSDRRASASPSASSASASASPSAASSSGTFASAAAVESADHLLLTLEGASDASSVETGLEALSHAVAHDPRPFLEYDGLARLMSTLCSSSPRVPSSGLVAGSRGSRGHVANILSSLLGLVREPNTADDTSATTADDAGATPTLSSSELAAAHHLLASFVALDASPYPDSDGDGPHIAALALRLLDDIGRDPGGAHGANALACWTEWFAVEAPDARGVVGRFRGHAHVDALHVFGCAAHALRALARLVRTEEDGEYFWSRGGSAVLVFAARELADDVAASDAGGASADCGALAARRLAQQEWYTLVGSLAHLARGPRAADDALRALERCCGRAHTPRVVVRFVSAQLRDARDLLRIDMVLSVPWLRERLSTDAAVVAHVASLLCGLLARDGDGDGEARDSSRVSDVACLRTLRHLVAMLKGVRFAREEKGARSRLRDAAPDDDLPCLDDALVAQAVKVLFLLVDRRCQAAGVGDASPLRRPLLRPLLRLHAAAAVCCVAARESIQVRQLLPRLVAVLRDAPIPTGAAADEDGARGLRSATTLHALVDAHVADALLAASRSPTLATYPLVLHGVGEGAAPRLLFHSARALLGEAPLPEGTRTADRTRELLSAQAMRLCAGVAGTASPPVRLEDMPTASALAYAHEVAVAYALPWRVRDAVGQARSARAAVARAATEEALALAGSELAAALETGGGAATCPVTLEEMRLPALASDGHTYEFEALLRMAARAADAAQVQAASTLGDGGGGVEDVVVFSPMTRERLRREVSYNRALLDAEEARAAAMRGVVQAASARETAWKAQLAAAQAQATKAGRAEAQALEGVLTKAQSALAALLARHTERREDEEREVVEVRRHGRPSASSARGEREARRERRRAATTDDDVGERGWSECPMRGGCAP